MVNRHLFYSNLHIPHLAHSVSSIDSGLLVFWRIFKLWNNLKMVRITQKDIRISSSSNGYHVPVRMKHFRASQWGCNGSLKIHGESQVPSYRVYLFFWGGKELLELSEEEVIQLQLHHSSVENGLEKWNIRQRRLFKEGWWELGLGPWRGQAELAQELYWC